MLELFVKGSNLFLRFFIRHCSHFMLCLSISLQYVLMNCDVKLKNTTRSIDAYSQYLKNNAVKFTPIRFKTNGALGFFDERKDCRPPPKKNKRENSNNMGSVSDPKIRMALIVKRKAKFVDKFEQFTRHCFAVD